jgi:hypothetical protein
MTPPVKELCDLGGTVVPARGEGGVLAEQDVQGQIGTPPPHLLVSRV